MGDVRSDNFATSPFDDTRFASRIRQSLREVVEATLVRVPGSPESRQDIRAAGERLGNALVAHTEAMELPDTTRPVGARTAGARRQPSSSDSDGHAQAFRAMAGVRL